MQVFWACFFLRFHSMSFAGATRNGSGSATVAASVCAIRAQANFAEYVPLVLFLMGIAELNSAAVWRLHMTGSALLAGRLLHAYCFACTDGHMPSRVASMVLTFAALLAGALGALRAAF